jgi:hypothetical protein
MLPDEFKPVLARTMMLPVMPRQKLRHSERVVPQLCVTFDLIPRAVGHPNFDV